MDGARRLGRNAMILSIVSILGGIAAIAATVALNWGCKWAFITFTLTFNISGGRSPVVRTRLSKTGTINHVSAFTS